MFAVLITGVLYVYCVNDRCTVLMMMIAFI